MIIAIRMTAAPLGTLSQYETTSPARQQMMQMPTDHKAMPAKVRLSKFAVIWGMDNRDITMTMPAVRKLATMASATRLMRM